jgi:hypothetical protein
MKLLPSQGYRGKQWLIGALAFLIFPSRLPISKQVLFFGLDKSRAGFEGENFQWLVLFP